jgi:hemoglobin
MAATPDAEGGSTVAMIRLATSFYAEMLNSPLLTHYFAGVQMDSLIAKQASFIDTIIRGDTGYPAADLQRIHAHLDIDDAAFDEMLAILDRTLRDYGMSGDSSARIHATFDAFRDVIVR